MKKSLSIITLNVNGLNALIKRHRIAEWITKHDPHICCLQETHLRTKDLNRLKVKGWKKIFQANGQEKKSWGSNTYIRQNKSKRICLHQTSSARDAERAAVRKERKREREREKNAGTKNPQ